MIVASGSQKKTWPTNPLILRFPLINHCGYRIINFVTK